MKNKRFNKKLTIGFVLYLAMFLVLFIVRDKSDFSSLENRNLETIPTFSFSSLIDKTFGEKFELFVSDQFPFRNAFIGIKSLSESIMQKKENNGVYIGKDNFYIEKYEKVNQSVMEKNAEYINDFSEKYNTYMMVAPTSITVNNDKLPSYVNVGEEEEEVNEFYKMLSDNIKWIDLFKPLKSKKDEYIYYKTDHHWTTLGAYYAYVEYCKAIGIDSIDKESFNIENVSNEFYGTLFSRGNFFLAKPDSMKLYHSENVKDLSVEYVFSNRKTDSIYEYKYLDEKDKYGVFLDNNHPLIKISTGYGNNKKLAVIKDSYAHSLIPFLINHYSEIYVIDMRLFKGSLNELLNENEIKDVLFMYNARNIMKDKNITRIKN